MDDASLDDFLDADDGETAKSEAAAGEAEVDPADRTTNSTDDGTTATEETNSSSDDQTPLTDDQTPSTDGTTTGSTGATATGTAVEPATVTMTFSADGEACDACGERVRRRWTDGDASVCRECKEW